MFVEVGVWRFRRDPQAGQGEDGDELRALPGPAREAQASDRRALGRPEAHGRDRPFSLVVTDDDLVQLFSEPDQITIHVRNVNDPPTCDLAVASAPTLWPPDHKMQLVEIENVMDRESDAYATFTLDITNVTQDELVEGLGDGDTAPDAVIQDGDPADTVLLRAERAESQNGRVYLVSFTADDGFENCNGFVEVTVPHTRTGEPAVDDGQTFDSTQN